MFDIKKSFIVGLISPKKQTKEKIEKYFRDNKLIYLMSENSEVKKELQINIETSEDGISEIIENIVKVGGELTSCTSQEISLQDIYNKVVKKENDQN